MASKAKDLVGRSQPFIKKIWNTYSFQRGVVQQQLSPFEVNVAGGLMGNVVEKLRHKVAVSFATRGRCMFGCCSVD